MSKETKETRDDIADTGTKVGEIDVNIGPRFLNLFSEHLYSSPNKAFEELVSNSWDVLGSGRADAAYKSEFDKWQVLIDTLLKDRAIPRQQRDAALRQLLAKQQTEANGARKRVMEEEERRKRARRRIPDGAPPTFDL